MPWIQTEHGMSIVYPRDAVYTGDLLGLNQILKDGLHNVSTSQQLPIGTMIYDLGGDSVYRYAEYGDTTKAGDVVQAEQPDPAHDDLNPAGSGTGAGVTAGSTIISIATSITLVVNEYANGFMVIEADTGKAYRYVIESNEVAAGASNANVVLWDNGLEIAIDSTSDVKLIKNRWKEVIICPTTLTADVAGVGMGVGADGSFGWIQTRGPAAVLTAGSLVVGNNAVPLTTAGAVGPSAGHILPNIGRVMDVGPTTEHSLIFLTLE